MLKPETEGSNGGHHSRVSPRVSPEIVGVAGKKEERRRRRREEGVTDLMMMKVKGKRETAPVLTLTAACSTGSCSSGDERREREQGGFGERGGGKERNAGDEEMGEGPSGFMRRKREKAAFG